MPRIRTFTWPVIDMVTRMERGTLTIPDEHRPTEFDTHGLLALLDAMLDGWTGPITLADVPGQGHTVLDGATRLTLWRYIFTDPTSDDTRPGWTRTLGISGLTDARYETQEPTMTTTQYATGSLLGLAYGDALGKPTEFLSVAAIVARYGQGGPRELPGNPALVTDDTQMALAVAGALLDAPRLTPEALELLLRERFLAWWRSPDNTRAPGGTCLRACSRLADGRAWQHATVVNSKGCGANMRVTPVGLIAGLDRAVLAGVAQLQAGMTHGHPTGLAAAELTAYAVRLLRDGAPLAELPKLLQERCAEQRTVYHHDWLGDLWQVAGAPDPQSYIVVGWDECAAILDRLTAALDAPNPRTDPCLATGAGWIAEEALATGLYCALLFPHEPVTALARAATTSGDSDSIACLTGAFLGAEGGAAIWPERWARSIEYTDQLHTFGAAWD